MSSLPLSPSSAPSEGGRLATIRRLYLYLVAFIGLIALLSSFSSLLGITIEVWLAPAGDAVINGVGFTRNAVARSGGLLLVAVPIYALHWGAASRLARQKMEARAALRKLYLYAGAGYATIVVSVSAHRVLSEMVTLALGAPSSTLDNWPQGWVSAGVTVLFHAFFLHYFHSQLRGDGDWGVETGWGGRLRRIYQTLVGLIGLGLALLGVAALLEVVLHSLLENIEGDIIAVVGAGWQRTGISRGLAGAIVGSLLWRANWRRWQVVIGIEPEEARAALRRLYLYAATVLSATATLLPAAILLRQLLLRLFGVPTDTALADTAAALAYLPLGILAWRWHWRQIGVDLSRYGDSPESATVRRLYTYAVAATGLVLLWFGAVDILRSGLDWLVVESAQADQGFRARQLANGLSLLAVGAPVWAIHWRTAQAIARSPGHGGRAERRSGPRRAYLYGVALVGALLILFELARVLYRLLLWFLGEPNSDLAGNETLDALVRSGTAFYFWIVHLLAIRRDTSAADDEPGLTEEQQARVATVTQRIQELESELERTKHELDELLTAIAAEDG